MKMRVADYVAEFLEKRGVTKVFLLSGGGMMHLLDAVSRRETLKYICQHHEQACGMAAEAYARQKGSLGVCYATSGPGGTNTLTAVVGAYQDSSPVLFISGQSKVSQTIQGTGMKGLRQFGIFEVDIVPIVESVTKYAAVVGKAADIRYHLEKATWLAESGRPGPVFLDVPVDVQGAPIETESLRGFDPAAEGLAPSVPAKPDVTAIVERLKSAHRPVILAGHGVRVSGAADLLRELVDRLGLPVVTTPLAADLIEYTHPCYVGHPGLKGDRPGNFAIQTADLILSLGNSLHISTTGYELDQFAPKAYKIMVDPDEMILKKENVGVQEKHQLETRAFLRALQEETAAQGRLDIESWRALCTRWKTELPVSREPHYREPGRINYYDFAEALSAACGPDDTLTSDAGSAFYVIGQAFRVKRGQRIISSGALGTMGFSLPAAIGAAAAAPGRRVVCVTGDGSLQTNIHDLGTLRQNRDLNVKVFVVNNDGYVSIRNTQRNFFANHLAGTSRESGVFIPDLSKLAQAYELPYMKVEKLEDLATMVRKVLETPGPMIGEIFTPAFQEILPTVSSQKLADGSMRSKPLHDMSPFMDEATLKSYLP